MLINTIQVIDSFIKKEVDTPTFTLQLLQAGETFTISETAIVRLIIESSGKNVVNKLITDIDNANGQVSFEINENLSAGTFDCELIVTDDGEVMTFPTSGYQSFTINRNLETISGDGNTIAPTEYEVIVDRLDSFDVALSTKANITHTHPISDITNLQTTLDNKSNTGHTHVITDVTGLNETLTEHQNLISQLDIESDAQEERLNSIESSVQTTDTLTNTINEINDNAGNMVEVTNVQGNTLQNVIKTIVSYNPQRCSCTLNGDYVTIDSMIDGYEDGQARITVKIDGTLLKPNTKYTLFVPEYSSKNLMMFLYDLTCFEIVGKTHTNYNNGRFLIETNFGQSAIDSGKVFNTSNLSLYFNNLYVGEKLKIFNNFYMLEGDWTNRTDIPDYFTGIESVNNPVKVKSIGKNLFDINTWKDVILNLQSSGTIEISDNSIKITNTSGNDIYTNTGIRTSGVLQTDLIKYAIKVKPNTSYTISFDIDGTTDTSGGVNSCYYTLYDSSFNAIEFGTLIGFTVPKIGHAKTITTNNNTEYIAIRFGCEPKTGLIRIYSNIQIEESSTATEYEPYKESTLQIPINEPLRSLPNGVCDYIEGGKIVRNVGKVVLDGSLTSSQFYRKEQTNTNGFCITISGIGLTNKLYGNGNSFCDSLYQKTANAGDYEHYYLENNAIWIYISKDKLTYTSNADVINYLESNPITIYYELSAPIIESIEYEPILQTYQDGHILLENNPIKPKVNVTYSIGLNGRLQTIESQLAKEIEETNNVFDATDLQDYWDGVINNG